MNYKKHKPMTGKPTKKSEEPTKKPKARRTMGYLPPPQPLPTEEELYEMYKAKLIKQGIATAEQIEELKEKYGLDDTMRGMKGDFTGKTFKTVVRAVEANFYLV